MKTVRFQALENTVVLLEKIWYVTEILSSYLRNVFHVKLEVAKPKGAELLTEVFEGLLEFSYFKLVGFLSSAR